jgi:putative transposase
VAHRTVGYGPLYQGRFKSFPVQEDRHLLTVLRYVERNARTAGLVRRAEAWRWGSLWARTEGPDELRELLAEWPTPQPRDWIERVNTPMTNKELEQVRMSVARNRPFGDEQWTTRTARRLDLTHTLRPKGRPAKAKTDKI